MSSSTIDPTKLPALPCGMEWRVGAEGARIRLRYRGKHVGTFDTINDAATARAALKRGEPWPPAEPPGTPAFEVPVAALAAPIRPGRVLVLPETADEMYRAFSRDAKSGRYHSKRNVSFRQETLENYHHVWERHCNPRFGQVPFAALDRPFLFEQLGQVSAESGHEVAIKARTVIQTTARYALDVHGLLLYNQIEKRFKIRRFRNSIANCRPDRILQPCELPLLLDGAAARDRQMRRSLILPLAVLLVGQGLRPAEALCLPLGRDGLDLDAGVAHIYTAQLHDPDEGPEELLAKSDDSLRRVPLDQEVLGVLRSHVLRTGGARGQLVFSQPGGQPVSHGVLRAELAKAAALGGLVEPWPVPYDLRRTYVSHALASGVSEEALAELLGHKHGSSLARQRYAKALRGEVARVSEQIAAYLRSRGGR